MNDRLRQIDDKLDEFTFTTEDRFVHTEQEIKELKQKIKDLDKIIQLLYLKEAKREILAKKNNLE